MREPLRALPIAERPQATITALFMSELSASPVVRQCEQSQGPENGACSANRRQPAASHPRDRAYGDEEGRRPKQPSGFPPPYGAEPAAFDQELTGEPFVSVERREDLVHAPPIEAAQLFPR